MTYQVNVMHGGPQVFNALVYGTTQHPGTVRFLESQMDRFDNISNTLTNAGREFFGRVRETYEQMYSSDAMRAARAALRRVGGLFQRDEIRSIWDLAELQQAPLTMQRWIMAEPTVREMYHAQRCDGYSDTYVDMHPNDIGRDHYDYRRVMSGVVQDTDDGGWKASIYLDELYEEDRELTFDEKVDVLNTWDVIRSMMQAGKEDPTSPYCTML